MIDDDRDRFDTSIDPDRWSRDEARVWLRELKSIKRETKDALESNYEQARSQVVFGRHGCP